MRPTISPARKTASIAKSSITARPVPTPPKTTSPRCMLASGTRPPSALKLSCIELTAPHEVTVVTTANSADSGTPKRASLPSMLPIAWLMCRPLSAGLSRASAQ